MSEQETPRTVEDAARTEVVHILDSFGVPLLTWQAARMPSVEQVAEVIRAHNGADGARWRCRCGWSAYDRPSDLAGHQAEQVAALWGAL